ncbi:MAG: formate--tetrahydrofolate ligase, partial [Saprospiraceae bacterium]|nr:formate--tetrahydrofolate ligase [Saprospiraceae bacterium]
AIIHGGPFANIAQGTNTVIATRMGLSLSEYVVTEAGFGFDLGGEKFLDIKCQSAGLTPSAVVLVATVRALKYHGGASLKTLTTPDTGALEKGLPNLQKHLENVRQFGLTPVVAINKFISDSDEELNLIQTFCASIGVKAIVANVWGDGGAGATGLAEAVRDAAEQQSTFKPLYNWTDPVKKKIKTIATRIYGADDVEYTSQARKDLKKIEQLGLSDLAVCMAKTQKSLSDNPALIGRPENFNITVREIEIAAGAGFIVPITGDMMRMPGLPAIPAAEGMDIDKDGVITGLF